jgi:hypothetical protein
MQATETSDTAWMMASAGTPATVQATAEILATPWMPATAGTLPKVGVTVSQVETTRKSKTERM